MERREPTLSSSSTPVPERDEPSTRKPAADTHATRDSRPMRTAAPPPSSSSSALAVFALLLALVGVGIGGYFGWQLTETRTQLLASDARIAELENRLSMSSDESSQSLTQVDAKLKWADSEIRKLWGVSNDVNRKAIAANGEKITGLTKELAVVKKNANDAKTTAAGLQPQLTASKAAMDASIAKIDSAVGGLTEQR